MKTIEIKLVEPCSNKLQLVKLIKDCSGMGLKESKDLCDNLHKHPEKAWTMPIKDWETIDYYSGAKTPAKRDYHQQFIQELQETITGKFVVTGGKEWSRDMKLIQLGMADRETTINALLDYILNKWSDSKEVLELVLSKLETGELIEVMGAIKLEKEIGGKELNDEFMPF